MLVRLLRLAASAGASLLPLGSQNRTEADELLHLAIYARSC